MENIEQRIKIAEVLGWKVCPQDKWLVIPPNSPHSVQQLNTLPDYCNDLNAMHEAERVLKPEQFVAYISALHEVVLGCPNSYDDEPSIWHSDVFRLCHATAAQRAEAFLRVKGKWE